MQGLEVLERIRGGRGALTWFSLWELLAIEVAGDSKSPGLGVAAAGVLYSSRPVAAQDPTVAVQGRACVLWDWRRVAFGGESRSAASLGRRRVAVGSVELGFGILRLAGRWEKTVCASAAIEISFQIEIVDAGKTGGRCHYSGLVRSQT